MRLPGKGVRGGFVVGAGSCRLWLAADHVLMVESQWFVQNYKRFYFRDIQALVIRRTGTGKILNIILAVLAFPTLLGALSLILKSNGDRGEGFFWGIISGVLIIALVGNSVLGPSCKCLVKTAVQTDELPPLGRLWRAQKMVNRLRLLINETQGELTPELWAAHVAGAALPATGGPRESSNPATAVAGPGPDASPPASPV